MRAASTPTAVTALVLLLLAAGAALAHEIRPAYLELRETAPGRFDVLWRTPTFAGTRLPITVKFPGDARDLRPPEVTNLADSVVERRWIEAPAGTLDGKRIEFPGLQLTITDVLVRVERLDGSRTMETVHPSQPWLDVATSSGSLTVAITFLSHGIEHILSGFDHLLFVLGLILIVRTTRMLLLTVTGFTVAHSITLSLATLGVLHVPAPPVEACIALSILLLASEILRRQRGEQSLTASWPWAVAFSFGLLHGLGFASALIEIGIPQGEIPLALFTFNVGVEVGQLAFIGAVLGVMHLVKQFGMSDIAAFRLRTATAYGVGAVAAFWFIERLASFTA